MTHRSGGGCGGGRARPIVRTRAAAALELPELGDRMDPSQTRLFLVMALVSLLFVAQLTSQVGAFAALP